MDSWMSWDKPLSNWNDPPSGNDSHPPIFLNNECPRSKGLFFEKERLVFEASFFRGENGSFQGSTHL